MIKELILEADRIIAEECRRIGLCELCKYNKKIGVKNLCVAVEVLACKYESI